MRIHDITQPLSTATAVWPGDRPVEVEWTLSRDRGDAVNVAALTSSVHAGTHADGFLHIVDEGETAAEMPLPPYIGRCVLVDVTGVPVVREQDLGIELAGVERLLLRTRAYVDPGEFPEPFAHLDPALARKLGEAGVKLIGTDAPSVDPLDSKDLPAHHELIRGRVAILESLLLTGVEPGEYTLVALPLRLVEADSSPVRAVLLSDFSA